MTSYLSQSLFPFWVEILLLHTQGGEYAPFISHIIFRRGEDKEDGILYYTKYLNCFEQDNELLIDHIKVNKH